MRPFGIIDPLPPPTIYWEMRAGLVSGTTLTARVGLDGTISNAPTFGAESVVLNGSTQMVRATGVQLPSADVGHVTLFARAAPDLVPGAERKIAAALGFNTGNRGVLVGMYGDGTVYTFAGDGTSETADQFAITATELVAGEYATLIATFDGSDLRVRHYDASGQLVAEAATALSYVPLLHSSAYFEVGRDAQNNLRYWDGAVTAAGYYADRALSGYECAELARRLSRLEPAWPNPDPTLSQLLDASPSRPIYLAEIQPRTEGIPQPDSLVRRYELADRSGVLTDSSAAGADATSTAGAHYRAPGRTDDASAIRFDATSGSGALLDPIDLPAAGWTISLGLRPEATADPATLFELGSGDLRLSLAEDDQALQARMDGSTVESTAAAAPIGEWRHVVATFTQDGADTDVAFFADGEAHGTATLTGKVLPDVSAAAAALFVSGGAYAFRFQAQDADWVDLSPNEVAPLSESGTAMDTDADLGEVLTFDGASYMELPSVDLSTSYEITIRVKYGSFSSSSGGFNTLLGIHDSGLSGASRNILLFGARYDSSTTGTLELAHKGNVAYGPQLTAGVAYTIIVRVLGTSVTWTLNGNETAATIGSSLSSTAAHEVFLGADWDGTTTWNEYATADMASLSLLDLSLSRSYRGLADHVYVWSAPLSSDEVAQLHRWLYHSRFRALSGDTTIDGLPLSVVRVQPVETRFDLSSHRFSISEVEAEFARDGWFSGLSNSYRLKGAIVTLSLGDQRLRGLSEFERVFKGVVLEVTPVPHAGHRVRLRQHAQAIVMQSLIEGDYTGHPLEVSAQILAAAGDAAGLTAGAAAELLDDTFDPGLYDDTISHYNVSRAGKPKLMSESGALPGLSGLLYAQGVDSPTVAQRLWDDLWAILDGKAVPDPATGRFTFRPWDSARAVDHLWGESDLLEVEPTGDLEALANVLAINVRIPGGSGRAPRATARSAPIDDSYSGPTLESIRKAQAPDTILAEITDDDSIATYGRQVRTLDSPWLTGIHRVDGDGTDFAIVDIPPGHAGVCGFGLSEDQRTASGWTQESWRTISADRPVYWTDGTRIVKATAAVINAPLSRATMSVWAPGVDWPIAFEPDSGTPSDAAIYYDGVEFDQFDTGASYPLIYTYVADITIAVAFARYVLGRFAHGCPTLRVRAHLSLRDVAIGDFVAMDWPYLQLARYEDADAAIGTSTVWEIVGKTLRIDDPSPHVELHLAWVRDDFATPVDLSSGTLYSPLRPDDTAPGTGPYRHYFDPLASYSATGLEVSFGASTLHYMGLTIEIPALDITSEPTAGTWIYWSTILGAFVIKVTADSDPEPNVAPWELFYAVLVSDATDVLAGLFAPYPLNGVDPAIAGSSISGLVTASYTDGSVTDEKIDRRGSIEETTTDATVTTVATLALEDNTTMLVELRVAAKRSGADESAAYVRHCCAKRAGAGVVIVDQTEDYQTGPWAVDYSASGNNLLIRVTGEAAKTIDWRGRYEYEVTT